MKPNVSQMQDLTTPDPPSMSLLQQVQSQLILLSESPYLDALVLISHVTSLTKSQLISNPNIFLTTVQNDQLELALEKLSSGTPLPYVLGQWEFYQLRFNINPDVLIPRPETEGLVDKALAWLDENPTKNDCLELGTGSGCIAVALAKNNSKLKVAACDVSPVALDTARENSLLHSVDNQINFILSYLLDGIHGKYDLLIANLPYIPSQKLITLKVFQTEPHLALDGGPDGLSFIKRALEGAPEILNPGALILLELDENCGQQALELARKAFPQAGNYLEQDLSELDRYLIIQT